MPPVADMPILRVGVPLAERRALSLPGAISKTSRPAFSQKFERLVQMGPTENSAVIRNALMRFRRQICAECENDNDPDCLCPLLALPLTKAGRQILERREQAMHPMCAVNGSRQSD